MNRDRSLLYHSWPRQPPIVPFTEVELYGTAIHKPKTKVSASIYGCCYSGSKSRNTRTYSWATARSDLRQKPSLQQRLSSKSVGSLSFSPSTLLDISALFGSFRSLARATVRRPSPSIFCLSEIPPTPRYSRGFGNFLIFADFESLRNLSKWPHTSVVSWVALTWPV